MQKIGRIRRFIRPLLSTVLAICMLLPCMGTALAGEVSGLNSAQRHVVCRDLSNTETVRLCYEAMLARAPDDEGLADWTALLDDGYSTTRLVAEFARSAAQATPALRTGCGALPR